MGISQDIKKTLILVWPLLAAIGMVMAGNGLQNTLLGLRASHEGFPVFTIGIIMAMYYMGYVIGCHLTPKMLAKVGHIRVFAAVASLASTTILFNGLFIDPIIWGISRIVTGASFAGLFIISESWLNDIAPNNLRARIFAAYISVVNAGSFIGQFFINAAPLENMDLFAAVSVLISLALIPITLADKPSPKFVFAQKMPIRDIMRTSPLSVVGVLVSGMSASCILGICTVYCKSIGMTIPETAHVIAASILGSATIPIAAGWFSDRFDRRKIIICLALLGALSAMGLVFSNQPPLLFMYCLGGLGSSVYAIAIAYLNDKLKPEQMVSATSSMILLNGIGACIGPIVVSYLMQNIGMTMFFSSIATCFGFLFLFGLYRAVVGDKVDVENQLSFVNVTNRSSPVMVEVLKEKNNLRPDDIDSISL